MIQLSQGFKIYWSEVIVSLYAVTNDVFWSRLYFTYLYRIRDIIETRVSFLSPALYNEWNPYSLTSARESDRLVSVQSFFCSSDFNKIVFTRYFCSNTDDCRSRSDLKTVDELAGLKRSLECRDRRRTLIVVAKRLKGL